MPVHMTRGWPEAGGLPRLLGFLASAAILSAGAWYASIAIPGLIAHDLVGIDYRIVVGAAQRWIDGGGFYAAYQLAGPYTIGAHNPIPNINYPPTALLLLVPFTVLPAVLWWVIPTAIVAWAVWHHRPRALVWPLLALLLAYPMTSWLFVTGNPCLWITAAVAAGTVRGPWAILAVLKPSVLAPLALIGVSRRSWWVALGVAALVSLPFTPLWVQYLQVTLNTVAGNSLLYAVNNVPMVLIPVVAWLGSAGLKRALAAPTRPAPSGDALPLGLRVQPLARTWQRRPAPSFARKALD